MSGNPSSAKLIAGLGNHEARYDGTRHNLGYRVVDRLADQLGIGWNTAPRLRSHVATARWRSHRLILLKPLTFMNASGNAVLPAMRFYDIPQSDLLVVVDDIALPTGRMRFRAGGSSGGHNGLKDIERALGTKTYSRLRIGAGGIPVTSGERERDMKNYVLARFTREEEEQVESKLDSMVDAVLVWADADIKEAMNRTNGADRPARDDDPGKEPRDDSGDGNSSRTEGTDH